MAIVVPKKNEHQQPIGGQERLQLFTSQSNSKECHISNSEKLNSQKIREENWFEVASLILFRV